MTNLQDKIREYKEYARMIEEMEALKNAIADELKAEMTATGQDKMIIGEYKLNYIDCTRRDIDKKRLEAEHKALYDAYIKETTYKRFSVA